MVTFWFYGAEHSSFFFHSLLITPVSSLEDLLDDSLVAPTNFIFSGCLAHAAPWCSF